MSQPTVTRTIANFFFGKITMLVLLFFYGGAMGIATFVESKYSTALAREYIYNNVWFYLLQFLMVVNFVGIVWRDKMFLTRKAGMILLHLAFVFMLTGAFITRHFGYEGILHLREGEMSDKIMSENRTQVIPFKVKLNDFQLIRYPGSHSPSSYQSDLTIYDRGVTRNEMLSMNNIIYQGAFRLYQMSYDSDEQGTVLTVSYDLAGTVVSYLGYLLLLMGFLVAFFQKNSRPRTLLRRLKELADKPVMSLVAVLLLSATAARAQDLKFVVSAAHADSFGRIVVQCPTGRIEPLNTYNAKLLRKIARSETFNQITADQFVLSYMVYPQYWNTVSTIALKNTELHSILGTNGTSVAFENLFDMAGKYKLESYVAKASAKPQKSRSALDKEVLKLDEKANILYALQEFRMYPLFPLPADPNHKWYSPGDDMSQFSGKDSMFVSQIFRWYLDETANSVQSGDWKVPNEILGMISTYQQARTTQPIDNQRLKYEILYNKYQIFSQASKLYLMLGFLLALVALWRMVSRKKWLNIPVWITGVLLFGVFLLHGGGIGLRWYISQQAPWSNAYESMIYIGWATLLAGLLFAKRSTLTLALSAVFAGLILFVANLNWMDPEITPLVPVLKSYWLMIHVAVITGSYGFFGVCFLIGLVTLVLMNFSESRHPHLADRIEELRIINELSMYIGLALLSIGTFLGAVWANESWGRYWGWDPKETWALISMMVYAFILHSRMIPALRSHFYFSTMSVYGLATILMTYFGVNYYLTGMHSYGAGDTPPALDAIYIGFGVITLLVLVTGVRRLLTTK